MVAKTKARKQFRKGTAHHRRLDDKMVTAVLVAAGISVLILLASFISVTGLAVSGTPDTVGMTSVLQDAELIEGEGAMKCSYACAREGKYTLLSYVNGELADNDAIIRGSYSCLCVSTD